MASRRWWESKLGWQNDSKWNQHEWNYTQWEPEPAGTSDQDRSFLIDELRKDVAILSSAVTEAQHAATKSAAAAAQAEAWAAVASSTAVEDVKGLLRCLAWRVGYKPSRMARRGQRVTTRKILVVLCWRGGRGLLFVVVAGRACM